MKDSKLFYALKHLSKRETTRFGRYLESPYFNTDPNLPKFYQHIIEHREQIAADQLAKEQLWHAVRTDAPFNDARFRKYNSDLLKHLEGFLYQEFTRQDKAHEYPFILDALNERKMDKLYGSILRSGRDALLKSPRRDSQYHQRTYAIEKRFYELTDSERQRGVVANTADIVDALDYFYIIEKLRLYCSVLGRRFYLQTDYELRLIDEIVAVVESQELLTDPAIEIYTRLVYTYTKPDDANNAEKLAAVLEEHLEIFQPDELVDIYYGIVNYYVRRANKGDEASLYKIVEVYRQIIHLDVRNAQGQLSPWTFKNALLAGLRTEQYDWALTTLEQHSHRLPEDYRENALAFNYAQVYFYKKQYGKVLEYLQQVEYQDPAYALNSRGLLVAVYYELGQIEPLYSTINSFRTYLKRQTQLSTKVRTGYRDLLKVAQRLAKALPSESSKQAKIQQFLDENPSTVSRQWLQTKLDELAAGKRGW